MKTRTVKLILLAMAFLSAGLLNSCSDDEGTKAANKDELLVTIAEANTLLTTTSEGVAAGNYERGSQAELQDAVDIAQVIADLPESTQESVDGANSNLESAIGVYESKIIEAIDPANLVGHWTFDELTTAVAGTAVKDYSGNNRNGTTKAGHTYWNDGNAGVVPQLATDRYGNEGKALRLNKGSNVEIPYNVALNPASISFSVWVKLSEVRNNRFIGLHSWNGYKFEVQDGNRPFLTIHASNNDYYDRDAAVSIGQDSWYHLVATHTAGSMKFYINGIMVKEWTNVPNGAITLPNPFNLVLGCDFPTDQYVTDNGAGYDADPLKKIPVQWGGYLNGYLDEVRIYKVALSGTQVTSIYNLEKPN